MTPVSFEKMPKPAADHSRTATIFVQIASYRDSECQHTVRDLFEKAANPDRIHVGICWQYDPEEDAHCFEVESPRPDQVSFNPFHWSESKGLGWARYNTQVLYKGEDYTLTVDSHMRFIPGWDSEMIEQLAQCKADKPILSCSPAPYTPPNNLAVNPLPTIRRAMFFNAAGEMRFKGMYLSRAPETPLNAAFIAGGFVFSSAKLIEEVPHDPYVAFGQEESILAARYYTHGWDIFSPSKQIVYHYYREPEPPGTPKKEKRPLFWSDRDTRDLSILGQLRYYHIMQHRISDDPEVVRELDRYGLGTQRSLDEYIDYCGVDYRNHKLDEQKALRCSFIKDLDKWITRVHVPELDEADKRHPFFSGQLEHVQPKQTVPALKELKQPDARPSIVAGGNYTEVGSFLPFFSLPNQEGTQREVQLYGGNPTQIYFLPPDEATLAAFFKALEASQKEASTLGLYQIFIIPLKVSELAALYQRLNVSHQLWADENGELAAALGLPGDRLNGFALSAGLQVREYMTTSSPDSLIAGLLACQKKYAPDGAPQIIKPHAPVLLVKNVLTPDMRQELMDFWATNERHEGGVGSGKKTRVQKTAKIRTDCFIRDKAFHARIDERLSRSLFPEIEKVYGIQVTRREDYKVGCYFADDGGFFSKHRDNFEYPLSYRRLAMTLVLNDDYEGGNLLFPEYTSDLYRIEGGDAVVFPCSLVHQVTPVTGGKRFVMISFYYGEPQAEHRAHLRQAIAGATAPADEWKVIAGLSPDYDNELSRYDNIPRNQWSHTYNKI